MFLLRDKVMTKYGVGVIVGKRKGMIGVGYRPEQLTEEQIEQIGDRSGAIYIVHFNADELEFVE